jgi:hypothetical protein
MFKSEHGDLRVDIPVGFLLREPREILVSVDRPADAPLAIRLRLVPAEYGGVTGIDAGPRQHDPPARPRRALRATGTDGFYEAEYGGGD